ncbi:unnamed protein product [Larinioides sclopetarius]|uniref:Transmembrane protein n=1 Tax=Larinioides sclopetarius TaxID=280406 RepID=A0AAV2BT64_9ARAC
MDVEYKYRCLDRWKVFSRSQANEKQLNLLKNGKIHATFLELFHKLLHFVASLAILAVVLGVCSAASFGGVKDLAGNYYDFSTGQYSSALTGKVYDTAPIAYVPPVAPATIPASYVAPAPVYSPFYGPAAYVAPFWKK